jgi:hypothetical protein
MLPYQAMAMDYAASFQRQPVHQPAALQLQGGAGPGIASSVAAAAAAGYSHSWFVQHGGPAPHGRDLHNGHVYSLILACSVCTCVNCAMGDGSYLCLQKFLAKIFSIIFF